MGIFSRFRDIVNSNINAMLDKAEDPEKLIRLMIQEMEDTLVELKASCASTMATKARVTRALDEAKTRADNWEAKARLAMSKGREDLAREALIEKTNYTEETENRQKEISHLEGIISQYQDDIKQLEEKLSGARNQHRVLVQRHIAATKRKDAQMKIRKADTSDVMSRFENFQNKIDNMEADADLVNYGRKPTLEDEFDRLESNDKIENELEALKKELSKEEE